MIKLIKLIIFTTFLTYNFLSKESYAANQGTSSTVASEGDLNIDITISDAIRVTSLSDIQFPSWSAGDGDVSQYIDLCVYSNTDGNYQVTALGITTSSFQITNGSDNLNYTAFWYEDAGAVGSEVELFHNIAQSGFANASTTSFNCSGGADVNGSLKIEIKEDDGTNNDLGTVSPGFYTGTLQITIGGS